ncbi:MAG: hypothetical protein Q9224_006783, partial [Gallowayella concinna]
DSAGRVAISCPASEWEDLFEAAAGREMEAATVVGHLLQAGSSLPITDVNDNRVLEAALAFFRRSRNRYDPDGVFLQVPSIKYVLEEGPGGVIKIFLAHLPRKHLTDVRYGLLLQMAAVTDDLQCVEMLLHRHVDVNTRGCYYGTALQAASRVGHTDVAHALLDAGADVNILEGVHGTAIRAAARGNHLAMAEMLAKHGADVNLYANKCTCDRRNCHSNRHRLDSKHQPILQLAVRNGSEAMVGTLLSFGAKADASGECEPWITDHLDASPLHLASCDGHENIVRLLVAHGAPIDKSVRYSGTALHVAACKGHLAIAQQLVEAGANVNYVKQNQGATSGDTALSLASRHGHLNIVQMLLHAGAIIADPPQIPNSLVEVSLHRRYAVLDLLLIQISLNNPDESVYTDTLSIILKNCDKKAF